jgi:hypothetical protein
MNRQDRKGGVIILLSRLGRWGLLFLFVIAIGRGSGAGPVFFLSGSVGESMAGFLSSVLVFFFSLLAATAEAPVLVPPSAGGFTLYVVACLRRRSCLCFALAGAVGAGVPDLKGAKCWCDYRGGFCREERGLLGTLFESTPFRL